ncbi:MAG TPA: carboxypeptidase-like regulatory domain-containing protein, partial [Gemmatimonadaceae bacterium]
MRRSFLSLITLTAIALALVPRAMAQSTVGTVSGTIRERGSERALAGVQVRVVGTQRAAISDATGTYRIAGVPVGTVQLSAQQIGYAPQARAVTVTTTGTTVDFTLAQAVTTLDQVVVTATGQSERRRESGASTSTIESSAITTAAV